MPRPTPSAALPLGLLAAALLAAAPRSGHAECDTLVRHVCSPLELVVTLNPCQDPSLPCPSIDDVDARIASATLLYPGSEIPELRLGLFTAADGFDINAARADLQADPAVSQVDEHDEVGDPETIQQSLDVIELGRSLSDFLNQPAATITKVAARPVGLTGAGVTVAVIDGGASLTNPLYAAQVVGQGLDVAGGGATVDLPPDGVDSDQDGMVDESYQHASHVAGLIHLVAPEASLLFVRVLDDDGTGEAFDLARGIVQAVTAGAQVLNISIGMPNDPSPIARALEYADAHGVVVVAGAGNRGALDLGCVDFPADRPTVIGVAAVDDRLFKAGFSSYGQEVALSAPGVQTLSTHGASAWDTWDGTSFATPLVTGAAALLRQKYPGAAPAQVKAALMASTQPVHETNPTYAAGLGTGVLDIAAVATVALPNHDSVKVRERADGSDDVEWGAVAGASAYDVVSGDLRQVRREGGQVSLGPLTCLAVGTTALSVPTSAASSSGRATFYVVVDDGPGQAGGNLGVDSLGEPRLSSGGTCSR